MAASQRKLEPQFSLGKDRQITRKKGYRQPVSLNCAINIICQPGFVWMGWHLPEEIGLFPLKASGDTLKIQKPPTTLIYACNHPYMSTIAQSIW
jgi:hypothetical protein